MIVGARGSVDLIHAESDRRAETRGQTPPGAKVPHSVVKVAVRAEREPFERLRKTSKAVARALH